MGDAAYTQVSKRAFVSTMNMKLSSPWKMKSPGKLLMVVEKMTVRRDYDKLLAELDECDADFEDDIATTPFTLNRVSGILNIKDSQNFNL